jgi:hypothetical protein
VDDHPKGLLRLSQTHAWSSFYSGDLQPLYNCLQPRLLAACPTAFYATGLDILSMTAGDTSEERDLKIRIELQKRINKRTQHRNTITIQPMSPTPTMDLMSDFKTVTIF